MNKDQRLLEEAYYRVRGNDQEVEATLQKYIADVEKGKDGDLDLWKTPVVSLPKELTRVRGDLSLYKTKITSLPEGLSVDGKLDVSFTDIKALPENLSVGGNLDLRTCGKINSLPRNLSVGGTLDLSWTKIKTLPSDIKIGRSLLLVGSEIQSLLENLHLVGDLNLEDTTISSLPGGLFIEGILLLKRSAFTKVSQLPLDLKCWAIDSWDFKTQDFLRHQELSKKLSPDFDIGALEDF